MRFLNNFECVLPPGVHTENSRSVSSTFMQISVSGNVCGFPETFSIFVRNLNSFPPSFGQCVPVMLASSPQPVLRLVCTLEQMEK